MPPGPERLVLLGAVAHSKLGKSSLTRISPSRYLTGILTYIRLLMIEDSEDDALLIERELRNTGFNVSSERIDTRTALDRALTESWDVVLCDWIVPGMEVLESVRLVKERSDLTPVVIVSGEVGEETAVLGMRAGASDFISKRNLSRLGPAIERELRDAERRREARLAGIALIESQNTARRAMEIQVAVLDALPATIAVLDSEGTIVAVNEGWRNAARRDGLTWPDFGVGRNYLDACLPDIGLPYSVDAADGIKSVLDRRKVEYVLDYPCDSPTRDRWIHMICAPVKLEEADLAAVMHLDISHRVAVEDSLRYREQMLQIALDSAGMGSWQLDPYSQVGTCRGLLADLFVDPDTGARLQLMSDLVDAGTAAEIAEAQRRTVEEDAPFHVEYSFRAPKDGETHWVACDGRLVRSTRGTPQIVGIVRDVTARRHFARKLETQVAAYARELSNIGADLELVRGTLSKNLARDLQSISDSSSALIEECAATHSVEMVRQLQHVLEAAQRTNQNLTDLGRLLRGSRREVIRQRMDLSNMVRNIETDLRQQNIGRDVEVLVDDGVTVDADVPVVTEILVTLLDNAWKLPVDRNPRRIEVGTQECDGDRAYFVRHNRGDTCPSELPMTFESSASREETDESCGINVGLAVASRIASRHGGRVWVENRDEQDTTVFFVLDPRDSSSCAP